MSRVKRGKTSHARHKKVLKQAKGYYGARSRCFKTAKQAVIKAGTYAFRDRRRRKRDFRSLWIVRVSAAAKVLGVSYSRLMFGLRLANIDINRKLLADLAAQDSRAFEQVVERAKTALSSEVAASV